MVSDAQPAPEPGVDDQQSPHEGRIAPSLRHFIHTEAASAGLLVAVALVALLWANSPWSDSYEDLWHQTLSVTLAGDGITMDLHHWVNDGLMVIFFFVIGLEVRREFAVGELTERRRLVIPVLAGVGGMVVPALLYLLLNPSGDSAAGWGIVIGTDTAFLLGTLALVGPSVSTQLRIFLLTLTVIDDIVAVTVIGVVYSDGADLTALAVAAACLVVLVVLDRRGEWRASPYVATVVVLWVATLESGIHASIAGMVSGLLVPAVTADRALVQEAADRVRRFQQSPLPEVQREARQGLNRAVSVNERLQEVLHGWTSYVVVPVFALANAGIDLRDGVLGDALSSPVTWGVVVGLVAGKTAGIGVGALTAARLRWGALPDGVAPGHILGGAALSGIGFTVSLLIVGLAFTDETLQDQAKVGVLLAAVLAVVVGWVVFAVAATVFDQRDASLPMTLSDPVDPRHDHVLGPVDAPLTLVEYLDFECPFCARATGAANEVREYFGDRLRYVPRHLPLDVHPHAVLAGIAAEAAGRQGRYWDMHELLFTRQDHLERDDLIGYAAELGLDVEQFTADLDDTELAERVARDAASADASGVRGTPTFFIGERRHVGPFDARSLIAALEAEGA
ncbi:Na+/H+ antiporter NhaA [Nocardioides sp. J54]|uniref:Na+/H+ antiporter NhaA n=1 Tax=Nocardioides sp. J54 TaxID=935866 RepID=UPI0004AE9D12|nr:Na+/H+ antiporter NhaA [Nocardioides sp. J54]